ncbi:FAD-dependent oxidoreductase [Pseudacidovorax intermedius]|uniref:3-(3-hydroxy-phenyl)propionate hydroxylase n=1 Tax=Pseudacidovorax intermedius TaxID=433924 RepID=A0A370FB91_9BURK|nr:FAD-dependent oxidoreductase [Pseudacidovorax intermedius]RDI22703.1 3-(3-hydroxy-phenyl)propionate hydroxylase [Pseudacidovorax intermedius]
MKPSHIPPHLFRGTGEQVQAIQFAYRRSPDQEAPSPVRHPVVIVGAGPVGLTLAIDLAQRGQPVLVVDNDDRLSTGSRALCFAKRTLEIWDRLGVGDAMVAKGVSWNLGKVFLRDQQLYQFNLLPEDGHERPAFINLQQYYCEAYLVERALQLPGLEIRWKNTLADIAPRPDGATLTLDTPDGPYRIEADWVVACDGSRSPTRQLMGLESQGRVFRDRFLIADVRMTADFPTERWFWFDPPFHPNQSVLLHREPDNVWRIDFQLGWDADPQAERQPEKVIARVRALLGPDAEFSLEWASVYTFACQRMERFVHGRVVFAGDSAHGVSPFGARGANSGVQDADNLGWKLDRVMRGQASAALIDTYGSERETAADENILHSSRATDFITPKSEISRLFRDQVLALARSHEFARRLVNSGRLSVPCVLRASPLNTPDAEAFDSAMVPGAPLCDAPLQTPQGDPAWLLRSLGPDFTLLVFGEAPHWVRELPGVAVRCLGQDLIDAQGVLARRLDAQPGTAYLVRPDQHVCARWRRPSLEAVRAALRLANGLRD